MLVAIGDRAAGVVAVADTIKEDSRAAIAALHELGILTAMITGDNERTAKYVAALVGIDEVLAGVLPEGKVEEIRRLQDKHGQKDAMVGDGINNAPALNWPTRRSAAPSAIHPTAGSWAVVVGAYPGELRGRAVTGAVSGVEEPPERPNTISSAAPWT